MTLFNEQSGKTVTTLSQRGTNDTLGSNLTVSSGEVTQDDIPRHLADASVEEDARTAHTRATSGRWQRFRLHWLTAYQVLIFVILVINVSLLILFVGTNLTSEASLAVAAA